MDGKTKIKSQGRLDIARDNIQRASSMLEVLKGKQAYLTESQVDTILKLLNKADKRLGELGGCL